MYKFFKWLLIIIIVIILYINFYPKVYSLVIIKPQTNIETDIGEKFSLKEGGQANIKNSEVILNLTRIEESNCSFFPSNCGINIGMRIYYTLTSQGKTYMFFGHEGKEGTYIDYEEKTQPPYSVLILDTDYQNYVTFIINKK